MAGEWMIRKLTEQGGKDSQYSDVLFGTVTSANPVEVLVGNNMPLPNSLINTGRFNKTRKVEIDGSESTVVERLKTGDRVALLRGHGGQTFYILDKV